MEAGGDRVGRVIPRPLVFVGDSITAGWAAYRAETFARLGFVVRGVPGETTGRIRARFGADLAETGAEGVHLLCGINDIAEAQGPVPDGELRDNLAAMLREARDRGLPTWIGVVMPSDFSGWRPELAPVARIRALNEWIAGAARVQGATFVDYHAPLATPSGALRPQFGIDGVHLNGAGYAAVEPVLLAALGQPAGADGPAR